MLQAVFLSEQYGPPLETLGPESVPPSPSPFPPRNATRYRALALQPIRQTALPKDRGVGFGKPPLRPVRNAFVPTPLPQQRTAPQY